TQAKMAELLKRFGAEETTHSGYVADFETSQRVPSVFTLLAYSRMTGISINHFVDDCLDLPEQVLPEENWGSWNTTIVNKNRLGILYERPFGLEILYDFDA